MNVGAYFVPGLPRGGQHEIRQVGGSGIERFRHRNRLGVERRRTQQAPQGTFAPYPRNDAPTKLNLGRFAARPVGGRIAAEPLSRNAARVSPQIGGRKRHLALSGVGGKWQETGEYERNTVHLQGSPAQHGTVREL